MTSTTLTYLDTSALMRKAEGLAANSTPRNVQIGLIFDAILADKSRTLACSEFTLVEFHSNITKTWRDGQYPDCDEEWWNKALDGLMDLLADGSLTVLPTPAKAIELAMAMVTVATKDLGRNLRAWDALHCVVATGWAYDQHQPVEIVTSDSDFTVALEMVGLSEMLNLLNLDEAAKTGMGADRDRD